MTGVIVVLGSNASQLHCGNFPRSSHHIHPPMAFVTLELTDLEVSIRLDDSPLPFHLGPGRLNLSASLTNLFGSRFYGWFHLEPLGRDLTHATAAGLTGRACLRKCGRMDPVRSFFSQPDRNRVFEPVGNLFRHIHLFRPLLEDVFVDVDEFPLPVICLVKILPQSLERL